MRPVCVISVSKRSNGSMILPVGGADVRMSPIRQRVRIVPKSCSTSTLQIAAASVLALLSGPSAQQSIARVALDENRTESLRVAAFDSLAASAKINANLLTEPQINRLVEMSINDPNLIIRSAASQALGALNLPTNKVAPIIDKYYRG